MGCLGARALLHSGRLEECRLLVHLHGKERGPISALRSLMVVISKWWSLIEEEVWVGREVINTPAVFWTQTFANMTYFDPFRRLQKYNELIEKRNNLGAVCCEAPDWRYSAVSIQTRFQAACQQAGAASVQITRSRHAFPGKRLYTVSHHVGAFMLLDISTNAAELFVITRIVPRVS
ncbi:hypothetical protein NDU88_001378 [Pleurodeles waltl]|uniref:Uncharacterized protein n=1 Tax=Pleurodeles waltl TaxID=8319 RepID=A0AAV7NAP6_PLEWA|nr:hypothetical protein NDU88_001378 [Pleurodeles waltl]